MVCHKPYVLSQTLCPVTYTLSHILCSHTPHAATVLRFHISYVLSQTILPLVHAIHCHIPIAVTSPMVCLKPCALRQTLRSVTYPTFVNSCVSIFYSCNISVTSCYCAAITQTDFSCQNNTWQTSSWSESN